MKRFWSKITKTTSCWIFNGCQSEKGYGLFRFDGKSQRAHRVAWMLTQGKIPKNKLIMHKCDNPPCVNPKHLTIGTPRENSSDMVSKMRQCYGEKKAKKLTREKVIKIKTLVRFGTLPHKEIAQMFGISKKYIWAIASGKVWKHIGGNSNGNQVVGNSI